MEGDPLMSGYSEEEASVVARWATRCQQALTSLTELLQPFFARPSPVSEQASFVLGRLAMHCTLTSDSVLALILLGKLWDAEMLTRSVVEGTLRFVFMAAQDPSERERRVSEYWDDLPTIALLKTSRRAESLLLAFSDDTVPGRLPIADLVLSQAQTAAIVEKYPSQVARKMARRWSFTSLVDALVRSDLPAAERVTAILHNYGLSSHLIHQDGSALGLIWDRENRGAERQAAITVAHAARQMSDVVHMSVLRAFTAYRLRELDPAALRECYRGLADLQSEFVARYAAWEEVEYRT